MESAQEEMMDMPMVQPKAAATTTAAAQSKSRPAVVKAGEAVLVERPHRAGRHRRRQWGPEQLAGAAGSSPLPGTPVLVASPPLGPPPPANWAAWRLLASKRATGHVEELLG